MLVVSKAQAFENGQSRAAKGIDPLKEGRF